MKNSFVIMDNWTEFFINAPIEQAGKLIQLLCKYNASGDDTCDDQVVKAVFASWKNQIDANNAAYEATIKSRSEAGKKGMANRWKDHNKVITNDNTVITDDNKGITKITDTDTVTDNDTVYDTVSPIGDNNIINSSELAVIKDQFNTICISLPKITRLTETRKKLIKTRLKEYSIDEIISVFEKAEASDFLSGRNKQWTGCNFDWLMKPSNIVKVIEGTYDNKGKVTGGYVDAINNRYDVAKDWLEGRAANE